MCEGYIQQLSMHNNKTGDLSITIQWNSSMVDTIGAI